jgi:signal transduction histidine kinase
MRRRKAAATMHRVPLVSPPKEDRMEAVIDVAELQSLDGSDIESHRGLVRDVHDVVGNAMTAIHLQAMLALRTLEQRPAEAAEALRTIAVSSQRSLRELRSILGSTQRPGDRAATLAHLDSLVAMTVAGQLHVEIEVAGDPSALPARHDEAAYRIVQESLTNVLRHAEATSIRLAIAIEEDRISLEISDNGNGTSGLPPSSRSGQGLRGMRERARLLGGDLSVATAVGAGFRVRAWLPLAREQKECD